MKKLISVILIFVMTLSLLAGCSAAVSTGNMMAESSVSADRLDDGFYYSSEMPAEMDPVAETTASANGSEGVQSQKLIRSMTLEAETADLDALLAGLDAKIRALGGYVENRRVRNGGTYSGRTYRHADLTVRIPVALLDSFMDHVRGTANVVSYQESAKDVTLTYLATESRVKALETEQARLLELLAKAENMSDLLTVEARLTDVRTELEQVTSQLRLYDNLVDYGTVNMTLTEVTEFTPTEEKTVWQRISSGFVDNLRSLWESITDGFVFVVVNLPYILAFVVEWGIIIAVVVAVIRFFLRRRRAKKPQPPTSAEE